MASLSNGTSRYRELCVECSKEWFKTTAKALIIGMRETCVNILRRETKNKIKFKIKSEGVRNK